MYDNAGEVWGLLTKKFRGKLTDDHRRYVDIMMDPSSSRDDRDAARSILQGILNVDPMYEVHWERSILDNPDLNRPEVREENRRLLFKAWFSKREDTEERNEARQEFEDRLGHDPLTDDGPMHDWDS